MVVSNGRGKTAKDTTRPFIFPSLKVDGQLWTSQVEIPNEGQGILVAQQEAAKVIRQRRAAMKAKEITVPLSGDSEVSKEPSRSEAAVAVSPVMSPKAVGPAVQEWLALHLPSSESLMSAAASMVGLQGVENRVRDLVANFKDDLDSFKAGFTSWFASVQSEWTAIVSNANDLLTAWGLKVDEVDSFTAALKTDLEAYVATLRGPKGNVGNTGMAGAATTVVDRLPKGKGVDFTRPFLGRDAVVGDICIDATTDMRYGWRWDGQGWERGPAMVSLQVRDVRVNSLDAAPRVNSPQTVIRPGSGSGGGLEKFLISTLGQGSYADLASNANWASAGYDSRAGELWIEVSDPATGLSGVVACVFDVGNNASETRLTEFALTGRLFEGAVPPDVDLDVIRGGIPPIPPSVTAVTNIGTAHTFVRVRVGANVGGSANYIIRGGIVWLQQAQGIAIPNDQSGPRPNWTWG